MKGSGNQLDYGARIYDPRVGKFLSVDPLTKQYPWLSPYQYAENSPIANVDLDGLEASYAADGRVIFGPYVKDPATGGKLYSANTPSSVFTYNIDQSKSSVAAKPVAKPKLNTSDNLQVPAQIVKAKQMAERALEPTSLKAYAEHMSKMPQAQVSAPNPRARYSDFEFGMITSPATHASIGMMVPGYNFTLGGATAYDGIRSGNYLQAGLGALGMVGGGFELYGRFGSGSTNALPSRLARVIPEEFAGGKSLGRADAEDVFVTEASQLNGLNSAGIAKKLTLLDGKGNLVKGPFRVIEFDTPASGLAQPFNRQNPGFVPGGKTAGGAPEYIIPNLKINSLQNVTQKTVQ